MQYVVLALPPPEDVQFRSKIKKCVFQVTRPPLNFEPDPIFFQVVLGDFQGILPVAILFPYHPHVKTYIKIKKSFVPYLFSYFI